MPICLALPPSDAKPRIMGGVGTRDFGVPRLCVFDSRGVGGWTGQPVLPTLHPPCICACSAPPIAHRRERKAETARDRVFCDVFFGVL